MSSKKVLFEDIEKHLLSDIKPSDYFKTLDDNQFNLDYPFTMLSCLKSTKQSPIYHPEGSVWNHTMLVIDEAAKRKNLSSDERAFMWAALLHDIGKPSTTKNHKGKITSYDHDKLGAKMAVTFLKAFIDNNEFIIKVSSLIRWHMQLLYVVKSLPYADIKSMKKQSSINDIALLGLCDRLGRLNADEGLEKENIKTFIEKCNK